MGIEYQEFRILVIHKKSRRKYLLTKQIGHAPDTHLYESDEFAISDLKIVSG